MFLDFRKYVWQEIKINNFFWGGGEEGGNEFIT